MKLNQMVGLCAMALFCGIVSTPVTIQAQSTDSWTNASNGNWTNVSNWSSGLPSSTFGDIITTNGFLTHIVAICGAVLPTSALTVSNLTVGAPSGNGAGIILNVGYDTNNASQPLATGPLQILNGLAINGGSAFVQGIATTVVAAVSGGNFTVNSLTIASASATISNGLLVVTNSTINIGSGSFNIDGGTVLAGQLLAANTNGAINLNSGTLVCRSTTVSNGLAFFSIGATNGAGSASSTALGGTHTFENDLYIGYATGGNQLVITNAATVADVTAYIGYDTGANADEAIVTGAGSVWNNSGSLTIGETGYGNTLTIADGGLVSDGGYGVIGTGPNSGTVTVTGPGSVWNNGANLNVGGSGNTLIIANGGVVSNAYGYIGYNIGSSTNAGTVTGSGSTWNNSAYLTVGNHGNGNTLTITNGGRAFSTAGFIGNGNSNAVIVTGSGSVWNNSGDLNIGYIMYNGNSNTLIIADGGSVFVTNGGGNATLLVNGFSGTNSLVINGGSVTVDALIATNGLKSVVTFPSGLLASGGTSVTNDQLFTVGDGADPATFQLNGGIHSFANNLEIRNNATLTGCGTIEGNVAIDPGGTVVATCGGYLTFTGIVTNNGIMHAENGSVLESYGPVVNNGIIDIMDGSTNFHSTFLNNGTVVNASYFKVISLAKQTNDIHITWTTVGGRSYVVQTNAPQPNGSYTTNFTDWSAAIAITGATLGSTNILDLGGATNTPARYYRIRLVP